MFCSPHGRPKAPLRPSTVGSGAKLLVWVTALKQVALQKKELKFGQKRNKTSLHQKLNGTLPTDPYTSKLRGRAIRYSGFFGVFSVGPVGDFLESQNSGFFPLRLRLL